MENNPNVIPDQLPLRLLIGFSTGWVVVAAVTSVADKYGPRKAGFAGGVPSIAAASLLVIGYTQSQSAAIQATTLLPMALSVTFAFLLFYAIPGNNIGFGLRMLVAFVLWFIGTALVAGLAPDNFTFSLAVGATASLTVFFLHGRLRIKDERSDTPGFSLGRMIWRGALGGCVVAGVVAISTLSGPLVGGIFAGVPAIWSSSLYVTSKAHDVQFSRSLTKGFLRTGIITIIPFYVAARFLFPIVGIWSGTLLSYLIISPTMLLAWKLTLDIDRRLK